MGDYDNQRCINCHFLSTYGTRGLQPNRGRIMIEHAEIIQVERSARQDTRNFIMSRPPNLYYGLVTDHLRCAKFVWTDNDKMAEGLDGAQAPLSDLYTWILDLNRDGKCFYFPFNPWMGLEAASELQGREEKNRRDNEDRELTREAIRQAEESAKQTKTTALATALLVLETFFLLGHQSFFNSAILVGLFIFLFSQFVSANRKSQAKQKVQEWWNSICRK